MEKPVMKAPTNGEDFERQLVSEWLVNAKCYWVVDLWSYETERKGVKKMQRKVQINFETDQMWHFGDKWDLPLTLFQTHSFFLSEQANLYKDLVSRLWSVEKGMNIFDLVWKTAELMVSHEKTKAWKSFAKIIKIKPWKKDFELVNETVMLSLDDFNQIEFDKLPEWLQKKIMETPEYKKVMDNERL